MTWSLTGGMTSHVWRLMCVCGTMCVESDVVCMCVSWGGVTWSVTVGMCVPSLTGLFALFWREWIPGPPKVAMFQNV